MENAGRAGWRVRIGGRTYGPVDTGTVRKWRTQGRILPGALVGVPGRDHWEPMSAVPELSDLSLDPPPSPTHADAVAGVEGPVFDTPGDCPECGGLVANVASRWGWPWGPLRRDIEPDLRCIYCDAVVGLSAAPLAMQKRLALHRTAALSVWTLALLLAVSSVVLLSLWPMLTVP